jgi:hypothetical protein
MANLKMHNKQKNLIFQYLNNFKMFLMRDINHNLKYKHLI